MARAAGFQANSVYISSRSQYFFNPAMMNPSQLNGDVTVVKLDGKDIYCDPGSKFAPFGLLPWEETFVKGLRLDKDGGGWVDTSLPQSSESKIERKADLKLNEENGSLSGKLTVTFSGLEALWRRNDLCNEDETSRKKFLENQIQEYIPAGIEVELKNQPEWNAASPTLVAVYDLKVPGWASAAGRRALLPFGLFSATEKQLFEHANRPRGLFSISLLKVRRRDHPAPARLAGKQPSQALEPGCQGGRIHSQGGRRPGHTAPYCCAAIC